MTDHYKTLNVTRDAEPVVIDSAYRALMKQYHPDKNSGDPIAAERAKKINSAYSVLRDPAARARYDRTLGVLAEDICEARNEPNWQPEPPPESVRPAPSFSSTESKNGLLTSSIFMLLALMVAAGSIGSVFSPASDGGVASTDSRDVMPLPPTAEAQASSTEAPQISQPEPQVSDEPMTQAGEATSSEAVEGYCTSANTAIEYLICSNPEISEADRRLNDAYSARLRTAHDPAALRSEQRDWLIKRNSLPSDNAMVLAAYNERIRELQMLDLEGLY